MKLHELVYLRNELERALDLSVIRAELEKNSSKLRSLKNHCDIEYQEILENVAYRHETVITQFDPVTEQLNAAIDNINQDINAISAKFFEENYQLELNYNNVAGIRAYRVMQKIEGAEYFLENRIQMHSSWKYPALEIGCRDGEWTKRLVASDPLYVTDTYEEFLHSAVRQFEQAYQNRVRKYIIQNGQIKNLPENQFGFIFSYNFFNYLSLDSIKQYLLQAMTWLRPGGTMLFTYNNADLPAAAGHAESYFMSYVPKSMLVPLCESVGFEVSYTFDHEPAFSWIELKKSGTLNTIKAGQALGEIKYFR